MKGIKNAAAVVALVVGLSGGSTGAWATGIPVVDGANLTQNVMTVIEEITQTATQLEEYATQIQQYTVQLEQLENMVKNTAVIQAANKIFNAANKAMNKYNELSNTLIMYEQRLGNLDAYLEKYKDINTYRNGGNGCLGSGQCTPAMWEELQERIRFMSEAEKDANEAVLKGNKQAATDIAADAKTLEDLQTAVHSAQGQVQVAQANGQVMAANVDQLLKLRAQLVAQSNAQAIRDQGEVDRKAREAEAGAQLRGGSFDTGKAKSW